MKRILRKLFPSLFPTSEYVTGSAAGLPCMLKCVAIVDGKRVDFEKQPLFLGYKPLVMGIFDAAERLQSIIDAGSVSLQFVNTNTNETVAELQLCVDKIVPVENQIFLLLTGTTAKHKLETAVERWAFRLNQKLSAKSQTNIDLTTAEYDMLKIGYSIPREIRLVMVMKNGTQNLFPIDLFGNVGKEHFVLSLRHSKKSCTQITDAEHTIVWAKPAHTAKELYAFGKNHSKDMTDVSQPSMKTGGNPMEVIGVTDISKPQVIADYGIHRILFFTILHSECWAQSDKLVHIHRSYANWHKRQGFPLKEIPH